MDTLWEKINLKVNVSLMAKTLGISETLATLIANKGIKSKNEALKYLKPSKQNFSNAPIKGIAEAINLINSASASKICIYGDYDVDGVMSICILYKILKENYNVSYYIPHRVKEGYGLNSSAVYKIHEAGTSLLILVDNGIAANEEIKLAKSLGMKVIIIDHHEPNSELPIADVIINPKQFGCVYPFKEMCAAGLCYRFALQFTGEVENEELLIFASIATICDVVDLKEDNRIIVRHGLDIIENLENKGLKSLLKLVNKTDEVTEETISYYLGPAINAAGRLDSAKKAVSLILDEDESKANEIFNLNNERKELLKEAGELKLENEAELNFLIIHKENLHESLAGILAGRLADKHNKPTLVFTGKEILKASGRSVDGFNLYKALAENRNLFIKFGGHEMAAGLTMPAENLKALQNSLQQASFNYNNKKKILIDAELTLNEVTYTFAKEISYLRPFGRKNENPIFLTRHIEVSELRVMEDKNTIIFTFTYEDRAVKGISFGMIEEFKNKVNRVFEPYNAEKIKAGIIRTVRLLVDVVYYIEVNSFRGNKSVQMRILDFNFLSNG
ncbi:MAG: single-stranded-DNA-specific exonuclease RecJ [Defluviitaleaceae bacterium]|nr:single-stranded-DNA-specific exonuclease RecJ [Defluviitaleaceae bacterium]